MEPVSRIVFSSTNRRRDGCGTSRHGANRMFERHFVAYGVRIGLRVDCRELLDALEQDSVRAYLPYGWRAVEDQEPDASVSVRYDLLTGASCGSLPSYRLYAGTNLLAEVRR